MALIVPKVVGDILRIAAPTLLVAFGGPIGAVAASLATAALNAWLGPAVNAASPAVPLPYGTPQPPSVGAATPAEIIDTVMRNKDDPRFLLALKQVEIDLTRYEGDLGFRFADLEEKSKQRASDFQTASGTAPTLIRWGMGIVVLAISSLLAVMLGSLLLIAGAIRIPAETAQLAVGVFGLIGTICGALAGYGSQVMSFYWGSSSGSVAKTDQITDTLQTLGSALGDAAKAAPGKLAPPIVVVAPTPPPPIVGAKPDMPIEWKQGPFGGVRFRLDEDGYLMVEGESTPGRTVGEPSTVRRIYKEFGPILIGACGRNGVPIEIAIACIGAETRGHANATLTEPDGRQSLGLMQVLSGTAAEVMGRPVDPKELLNPEIGIEAGVRYLAKQRTMTSYLPPFSAASYNAGGLYAPREQDNNRWALRSTGDHIDRFVLYFNDSVAVAEEDNWSKKPD